MSFPDFSPDLSRTTDAPELQGAAHEAVPSESAAPLESVDHAAERISSRFLLELNRQQLDELILRALNEAELANSLIGTFKVICDDSGADSVCFQSLLCESLAAAVDRECGDMPLAKARELNILLTAIDVTCDALEGNSSPVKPGEINLIMRSLIELITELDEDRESFEELHEELGGAYYDHVENWGGIYVRSMDLLMRAVDMPGFTVQEETCTECRELLRMQLVWQENERGPGTSRYSVVAEVWDAVMNFAAIFGDDEFGVAIAAATDEIFKWVARTDTEAEAGVQKEFEDEWEIDDSLRLWETLDRAQLSALRALYNCQYACTAEPIWKEVLESSTMGSVKARIALLGLADSDIEETRPYVVRLLNDIGAEGCKGRHVKTRMETLEYLLAKKGAVRVFEEAFDMQQEGHINPLRQEKIIAEISDRLKSHHKWVGRANAKVEAAPDANTKERVLAQYAEKGVIWSAAVLYALESAVRD